MTTSARNGRAIGKPAPFTDAEAARLAVRTAQTREPVPADVAKRLPAEWGELLLLVEESGLDAGIATWLKVQRSLLRRDLPRFEALTRIIEEARSAAENGEPADSESKPNGPAPFSLDLLDSASFFGQEYRHDWLVKGVTVRDEPGVVGGPSKSLKTSILIDKVISLGTATPFLGKFEVPQPRRVALISGESGRRVIQANARQVCLARGLTAQNLTNICWGFTLPQLNNDEHLAVLKRTIEERQLEYVALDPFYLTLMATSAGVDPSSMFQMGPILFKIARTCMDSGCTPELAHHFTKRRDDPFGPPELADLAYAGIGQFIRQWMLIAPRERFDAETGLFKLHFYYGGSAGHCGEHALDIEVGKLDPDIDRRCWKVSITSPSENRAVEQDLRLSEQARKAREREQAKAIERTRTEREAMIEATEFFRREPGRRMTVNRLRIATDWRKDKADRIIYLLCENNTIRPADVSMTIGNGATRNFPGFELIEQ